MTPIEIINAKIMIEGDSIGFVFPVYFSRVPVIVEQFLDRAEIRGTCVEICPVENITLSKRRPVWHNQCINCFACYNLCPWRAIQVRCPWKIFQLESDFTQMPRYRHPDDVPARVYVGKEL